MTRLIVKSAARNDVLRQVRYMLDQDAERAASRFPAAFQKTVERIMLFPKIGAPRKLRSTELKNLRSWPIPGFKSIRVCYIAARAVVRVLRVLHDRQDLERLLPNN